MEKSTDLELMKLIIKRNSKAFKIMYYRYEINIFNFILRYTGSREIAQDLLQETFARIWFAAHTFDQKKGNFKGWLFKIALNITRNEMSKKQYEHHYYDVNELDESHKGISNPENEQPDSKLYQKELKNTIAQALSKLQPFLREIVILKHFQQLKFREIALITDTPEGTLKARFHRAICQLREILQPVEL